MSSRGSKKGRAMRPDVHTQPAADTPSVDQATQELPHGDPEKPPRDDDPAATEPVPPAAVLANPDEESEAGLEPAQPEEVGATPIATTEGATSITPVASLPALIASDVDGNIMPKPEVISDLTLLAERINASFSEVVGSYRTTVMHAFRVGQY